jgi:hypothetical protein
MQRQNALLLGCLDRNETHVRPGHGFADGFGVRRIVFVGFNVGFDELWGHQFHGVPE